MTEATTTQYLTKSILTNALKPLRFGFVKMCDSSRSKSGFTTYHTHSSKKKGIIGGSIGPMTVTNAHLDRNRCVTNDLIATLKRLACQFEILEISESSNDGVNLTFKTGPKKTVTVSFSWHLFPAYSGRDFSSYQNYWLVYNENK